MQVGRTQAWSLNGLDQNDFPSSLLEFLFLFLLTFLKVKMTESQKIKDRKTLDMTAGWTSESFHSQVWVDQRL